MAPLARFGAVAVVAFVIGGAATAWVMNTNDRPTNDPVNVAAYQPLPQEGVAARIPVGDLAGTVQTGLPAVLHNPLNGNAQAAEEGHRLYNEMNCAGCHGYTAKGGMGPDLTDTKWRYGGTPIEIYKSIYEGRPKGMPAWGRALPSKSIWELTTYLTTLGGTFPEDEYQAGKQGDLGGTEDSRNGAGLTDGNDQKNTQDQKKHGTR